MSKQVKQSKKSAGAATTEQSYDELWRSGRSRWNLRQFSWGKDKKWHFPGQQPEEEVKLIVRKHWRFMIGSALPMIGSAIALVLVVLFHVTHLNLGSADSALLLLDVGLGGLLLITAGRFFTQDYIAWRLETYIITNKRIINSRGLLQPTKQETPIEKVTQIGVHQETPLSLLLSYGTVHAYLVGGDLVMREVPHPRKIKEVIEEVSEKTKKPEKEKPPVPKDPELASLLDTLAKGKEPPRLTNADERYPIRNPDRVLGPRRTFGGPFRIPAEVHYTSGEFAVEYVQRSRYVLYRKLVLPIFALALDLVGIFLFSSLWFIFAFLAVGLLITLTAIYVNWADDVYILTNKRIIEIDRKLVFLFEERMAAEYKNIRDVKVIVHSAFERLLDVGDVFVETPGNSPDIILHTVDHPFIIQDKIYAIKGSKEKAEEVEKANKSKEELKEWFARVLTTLEGKTQANGAPNLYKQDLWSAMQMASQFGLRVVTLGESSSYPELAPGLVIHQSPPPGTLMNQGSEIQVILSGQG